MSEIVWSTIETLRKIGTGSSVTFSFLVLLTGSFMATENRRSGRLWKVAILALVAVFFLNEIRYAANNRDNQFKFLKINNRTPQGEFIRGLRQLRALYHPDNHSGDAGNSCVKEEGNQENFIRVNELAEGLQFDYTKKVAAYELYGDSFDLSRRAYVSPEELSQLETGRVIDIVMHYLMLLLILVIFFLNKAGWSVWNKVTLGILFVASFLGDTMLFQEAVSDDGEVFKLADELRDLFDYPYLNVAEMLLFWRMAMLVFINCLYMYGIMWNPKDEDILIHGLGKYYASLHRAALRIRDHAPQQELACERGDAKKCSQLLEDIKPTVQRVIEGALNGDSFYKKITKFYSVVQYGMIAVIVGWHLYSKHGNKIQAFANQYFK